MNVPGIFRKQLGNKQNHLLQQLQLVSTAKITVLVNLSTVILAVLSAELNLVQAQILRGPDFF